MRPVIIFGVGELAELAFNYFTHDSPRRVAAFTVDAAYCRDESFQGLPLLPFDQIAGRFSPQDHDLFVAVGYARLNAVRAQKCAESKQLGYRLATYVSSKCVSWPDLQIGENCLVMEGNVLQPLVKIGNNVIVWCNSLLSHHVEVGDDCFISAHAVISGHVKIGKNCFIGVNSTIRDKIRLADRTIVGAGATILADTEENSSYITRGTEKSGIPSHRLSALL